MTEEVLYYYFYLEISPNQSCFRVGSSQTCLTCFIRAHVWPDDSSVVRDDQRWSGVWKDKTLDFAWAGRLREGSHQSPCSVFIFACVLWRLLRLQISVVIIWLFMGKENMYCLGEIVLVGLNDVLTSWELERVLTLMFITNANNDKLHCPKCFLFKEWVSFYFDMKNIVLE